MNHGIKLFSAPSASVRDWRRFIDALRENQTATQRAIAQARKARDLQVTREDLEAWKQYQGDFQAPIRGIRSLTELSDDLIVCYPHLEITRDTELETARRLTQLYTSYREHESRAVNPRKYDKPFYLRWFEENPEGRVLVLTPTALPNATNYVLNNDIMARFDRSTRAVDVEMTDDVFELLDLIFELDRLDRVKSARASVIPQEGEPPSEIAQPFIRDAGTLANFRAWYARQQSQNHRVSLISVRFSVLLEDLEGATFDVVVRPGNSGKPITLSVGQRSSARRDAYELITSLIYRTLRVREGQS